MAIPQVYEVGAEAGVASYDYTDIASGVGYSKFYLMVSDDDSGRQYSLQPSTFYSFLVETKKTNNSVTLTFDSSPFNLPRTIRGTAYLNIGIQMEAPAGDITATFQKWDGSNATNIATPVVDSGRNTADAIVFCFEMPCTQTIITKGEQLRLVLTLDTAGTSGEYIAVGHDPLNRDGATLKPASEDTITSSNINVPFRIDL